MLVPGGNVLPEFNPVWIVRMDGGEPLSPETEIQTEGIEWKTIYKHCGEGVLDTQFKSTGDVLCFEFTRLKRVPITIELSCGSSHVFQDIDGVRTYALKDGMLQSVCQLVDSRYNADRICELPTEEGGCDPLLVKISRDGNHSIGLSFENCSHLMTNQQPEVSSLGASFDDSQPIRGELRMTEDEAETLISLLQPL